MDLLSLPVVMVENIFSYLTYDEIAKNRLVCRSFNDVCMRMLNRGFLMIERRHALALKNVKAQLPRRESERRYHPLSRHCDILTSIETRISMLNMTYSKYIENKLCCFIPGKVIDEIRRVLAVVEISKTPPRAHEVLQELRDISSMAIEHFDDKISPAFRKRLQEGVQPPQPRPPHAILAPIMMHQELLNLRCQSKLNTKLSLNLAKQYKIITRKMLMYRKTMLKQRTYIRELRRKQFQQEASIADLKKRIEECDIKYSELTHTNQAVGGKSATAGEVSTSSTQSLRNFGSQIKLDLSMLPIGTSKQGHEKSPNIKPRKPQIRLPSISDQDGEAGSSKSTNSEKETRNKNKYISPTLARYHSFAKEVRQLLNISFPLNNSDLLETASQLNDKLRGTGTPERKSTRVLNRKNLCTATEDVAPPKSKKRKMD